LKILSIPVYPRKPTAAALPFKNPFGIPFGMFRIHNQTSMFTQQEIPALIARQLPQVQQDLCRAGAHAPLTAFQSIQVLTDYTKRMALEHDFTMVGRSMTLMGKLYEKGDSLVRNAVENIFIYSFSTLMCNCNIVEWRMVQSFMPSDLYAVFIEQVLKSKC